MKKTIHEGTQVKFSNPDPATNIIRVSRVLSDGSEESIGQIYPDFADGEDSIKYVSVNYLGEELLPPTSDFIDIENRFVKYIQEMDEKTFTNDMEEKALEFEKRGKVLKGLRQWKFRSQLKFINR